MTGLPWPPNNASNSSINLRCASLREMAASKMFALLILLTRRSAFLRSRRVNGGLDRCVGWPAWFGKCFLNFPDGTRAPAPERVHDLKFEFG